MDIQRNFQSEDVIAEGVKLDKALLISRDLFDALRVIESAYTERGCLEGRIGFKQDPRPDPLARPRVSNRMVVRMPRQPDGRRPWKYIGSNPLLQTITRAKTERYSARNALRIRYAALHSQWSELMLHATALAESAERLRAELERCVADAADAQDALERATTAAMTKLEQTARVQRECGDV